MCSRPILARNGPQLRQDCVHLGLVEAIPESLIEVCVLVVGQVSEVHLEVEVVVIKRVCDVMQPVVLVGNKLHFFGLRFFRLVAGFVDGFVDGFALFRLQGQVSALRRLHEISFLLFAALLRKEANQYLQGSGIVVVQIHPRPV